MPSVIKTLSSYRLNVIQGVTSLTSDLRLTQNTYKIPKSIDFNINKTLNRTTIGQLTQDIRINTAINQK